MKRILTLVLIAALCSCNDKADLSAKIMALKDSCSAIDMQLDTLKAANERNLNAIFHSSDTTGVEKLIADAEALTDTANHSKFIQVHNEYADKRDPLEARKKQLLRQIDSLQLKLQE